MARSSTLFAASGSDPDPRLLYLEARDARQRELDRALQAARGAGAGSVFVLSTAIPGADKHRPGVTGLFSTAVRSLSSTPGWTSLFSGSDLLGPYCIGGSRLPALEAKHTSMAVEGRSQSSRLLDVDVMRLDGSAVDRAALGLPPRSCLLCEEPAKECVRLRRHTHDDLIKAVTHLLAPFVPDPGPLLPEPLAISLVSGALRELDLTPKPGLVDRHNSGSHTDLSYEAMRCSVGLLPTYFADILRCSRGRSPLRDCMAAGRMAEERMVQAVASNAHKGLIFLAGLVLMAACEGGGDVPTLRRKIGEIAVGFFQVVDGSVPRSHGGTVRSQHGLGGIRSEAEGGLPAVFDHGWPMYREVLGAGWSQDRAGFYLMAVLMEHVEDTTAVHRCGVEGLRRLRHDGTQIRRILEQGRAPEALLTELNEDYVRTGLTMGGVADCMALTFGMEEATRSNPLRG